MKLCSKSRSHKRRATLAEITLAEEPSNNKSLGLLGDCVEDAKVHVLEPIDKVFDEIVENISDNLQERIENIENELKRGYICCKCL